MSFKKPLLLKFTDFQDLLPFKDFPILGNATLKFKYFSGFPGPIIMNPDTVLTLQFTSEICFEQDCKMLLSQMKLSY